MNPKTWPTGLKLAIGAILLAGNAVLPWLAKDGSLSPAMHAGITSLAGLWLLLVNTWNAVSDTPVQAKPPTLPLGLTLLALLLVACQGARTAADVTEGAACGLAYAELRVMPPGCDIPIPMAEKRAKELVAASRKDAGP